MAELKTYLVVNPQSAGGRTGKRFPEIAGAVRGAIGDFDHAFTNRIGEATDLARAALGRGYQRIVAVGGDGTINEVANGFFDGERAIDAQAVFAIIPRGTGGDFRKTFGWGNELGEAVRRLASPNISPIDVGRIRYQDHDGKEAVRHFVNIASCGVSGVTVDEVNHTTKVLGGRVSFTLGSVKALLKYRDRAIRLSIDDGPFEEVRITCLAVGNGQYFGSGMMVCPQARPDDGTFDVTIWSGFGLADFALKSKSVYDGSHIKLPGTRTFRAKKVRAETVEEVLLDVDGEQPGRLPATWELLPGALRFNR
jgi:YegS/Rv2252/BmrU family lipid kinase